MSDIKTDVTDSRYLVTELNPALLDLRATQELYLTQSLVPFG